LTDAVFAPGSTAVRRDVLHGRVWTAAPHRVLADSGSTIVLACWPGLRMLAPTTWIHWLRTGDDDVRKQAIPNLAAGRWDVDHWTWRDTTLVSEFPPDQHFSVHRFLTGGPAPWYVNFELPYRRTPIGIDTFDLLLDLVVAPDLSGYTWKDEDEYAHGRRIGLIDDATHAEVEKARDQVLALVATATGPFAHDRSDFAADPAWPAPVLPAHAGVVSD
jgi:protein associated with RNAse G/E